MSKVLAGAEPFRFEGERRPVLLLHGFTGTTQSMRYVGERLNARFGFTVAAPRLAGHGTSPDDMAETGYRDWLGSAEATLQELAGGGEKVCVAGLSMGGALTLNLAARFPELVAGAVSINGAAGIFSEPLAELMLTSEAPERIPGIGSDIKAEGVTELAYQEVPVDCLRQLYVLVAATRDLLPRITAPLLVMQSRDDHVVHPDNARVIVNAVASDDVRLLRLNDSYHVATLDNDKDLIVERMAAFFAALDI